MSAVLTLPLGKGEMRGTGVIAAHGAGNDMEHPLLAAFTDGLAGAGVRRRGQGDRPRGGQRTDHSD
ncbi:MAG TPA: hypothetical protein PLT21_09465, partial [Syntrophales bacterium]|nr:hypothetical protein [Syntrophales bacterium]